MKTMVKAYSVSILLCVAANSHATIHRVGLSEVNTSILQAYTTAVSGDTIIVSSASYSEALNVQKSLVFIGGGFSPSSSTTINAQWTFNSGSNGSVIEGFRFDNSWFPITIGSIDDITIRRCYIKQPTGDGATNKHCITRSTNNPCKIDIQSCILHSLYPAPLLLPQASDTLLISNSIISGYSCIGRNVASLLVNNCTIVNSAFFLQLSGSFNSLISNNIFYDWNGSPNFGFNGIGTWEYNASSTTVPPGSNSSLLSTSPFVDYSAANNYVHGTTNLHLNNAVPGNPCIDSGQPVLQDLDGSPCDLGIYGGLQPFVDSGAPSYPFVTGLTVPGAITVGSTLPISGTGRIGRGY